MVDGPRHPVVKLGHGTLMFVRARWLWTALGSGLVGVVAVTVAWEVMPPISECLNSGADGVACGAAPGVAGLFFAFPAALLTALLGARLLRLRQWWQVGASATFLTAVLTTVTHIDTWRALAALGAGVFFLTAVAFATETMGSEQALAYAQTWIRDADPGVRDVGFMALGSVALNYPPALEVLLDHADAGCADVDVGVRAAVAQALGNQSGEQRCVPFLLRLLNDADVEVRRIAIGGFPIVLDDPTADDPAVTALVGLLADPEPTLRDWAAFALGCQLDVDSPQIRAGLRSLLSEPDTAEAYPAAEAALGLARRADPEVFAAIADRLTRPDPSSLWLRAAAELADPRLLPALVQLRAPNNEPDDPWAEQLEHAIARCTVATTEA